MPPPSPRCLANRVTLYRLASTQDEDAGLVADPYGPPFAIDVPCSVQPAQPERVVDPTTRRLTESTRYDVMFRDDHSLAADDKLVWVDGAGIHHALYVRGTADQAGRGLAFIVSCEERT